MNEAEALLTELANAIIAYRLRGEKDFVPVNNVLIRVDRYRSLHGFNGEAAKEFEQRRGMREST